MNSHQGLPAESVCIFQVKSEAQQADINRMTDSTNFEQRASTIYNADILQQLASLSTDLSAPLALLLTGLLVEDEPFATSGDPPLPRCCVWQILLLLSNPLQPCMPLGCPARVVSCQLPVESKSHRSMARVQRFSNSPHPTLNCTMQ